VTALLVLAAGAGLAGVVVVLRRRASGRLMRRLAPYLRRTVQRVGTTRHGDAEHGDAWALTNCEIPDTLKGVLRPPAQAVEHLAADLLDRHAFLARTGRLVERANLRVTAPEVVGASLVLAAAGCLLTAAAGAPVPIPVLAAAPGAVAPTVVVSVLARRRQQRFSEGLPDVLRLLAGTIRAGFPIAQAVAGAAEELGGPVAEELRRVAAETSLGRSLPEALGALGTRMGDEDIAWVALALDVQQQTGGNLAELLDQVARTIALRHQLAREVRTLTAEGRLSAIVLGLLPPGLAVGISVLNPGYVSVLATTSTGRTMAVAAALAMGVGFIWMARIIRVEV
jgi:tight adherence protein B